GRAVRSAAPRAAACLWIIKGAGRGGVPADAGGSKPLNWMTPPVVLEEGSDTIVVRKRAGRSEDRLEIRLHEVLSDVEHEMGEAAALGKDGRQGGPPVRPAAPTHAAQERAAPR